jgi:predicted AlkP superfamily pyrophosphatase or phosphodiesterase
MSSRTFVGTLCLVAAVCGALAPVDRPAYAGAKPGGAPQVVVISLDGARADVVDALFRSGALDKKVGLGRLDTHGVVARQNITLTPSLTAVAHIGIATGSGSARNDVPANIFHPVAASIGTSISGFAAPIGGYTVAPLGATAAPTAEPLWVRLRQAGKKVVTATWPGSDGADVRIAGTLVQPAVPGRVVDYTVPFGAFGGLSARGFALNAGDFTAAGPSIVSQLAAAGRVSHSPVRVTAPLETVFCSPTTTGTCGNTDVAGWVRYDLAVAALDSTNDGAVNYDTLVIFDTSVAIAPGPFALPATGPAYVRAGGPSARFFFEGSGNKIGTAFFVSHIDSGLVAVRLTRYAANFIPRNPPVLGSVEDVNTHVGFWGPQPDFRIPERLAPNGVTFATFSDEELEAIYVDQVSTFVTYQRDVALRAIEQNPDADLVMVYIEQPDGSGHQFTLTDSRQPTNPLDNRSVGKPGQPAGAIGQDSAKIARYARYLAFAYQQANAAVDAIIDAVGSSKSGEPLRDVFVVSDHGMAPFHTAVNLRNLLIAGGFDVSQLGLRTSGPAANIYVNLQGRESGAVGPTSVAPAAFPGLVAQLAGFLSAVTDTSAFYNPGGTRLFGKVFARPSCPQIGFCTDDAIGQDTGDVLALTAEGYNFDGAQAPLVFRLGDVGPATSIYSVPNFYGAHGHDSTLLSMSAILYAAGPRVKQGHKVDVVHNIDIAPTVLAILGVARAPTVEGTVLEKMLHKPKH